MQINIVCDKKNQEKIHFLLLYGLENEKLGEVNQLTLLFLQKLVFSSYDMLNILLYSSMGLHR